MKIYNIHRSGDFFRNLSKCEGRVSIVREDGNIAEFRGHDKDFQNSELSCFNGTIPKIELKFQKAEDLDRILNFIINQRKYA